MIKPKYSLDKLEHMSEIMKAVAHPLRISIIDLLLQTKEIGVSEMQSLLSVSQPEVSRQLQILKNAGLVNCRKEGTSRVYFLLDKEISGILNCLENCIM